MPIGHGTPLRCLQKSYNLLRTFWYGQISSSSTYSSIFGFGCRSQMELATGAVFLRKEGNARGFLAWKLSTRLMATISKLLWSRTT